MCCCCQNSNVLLISSFPGWAVPRRREENFLFVGQAREMASNCRPSLQQAAGVSAQLSSSSLPPMCLTKQRGEEEEGRKKTFSYHKQTNKQRRLGPGCKLSTWSADLLCLLACCHFDCCLLCSYLDSISSHNTASAPACWGY